MANGIANSQRQSRRPLKSVLSVSQARETPRKTVPAVTAAVRLMVFNIKPASRVCTSRSQTSLPAAAGPDQDIR
jgi:hypothetical protein